MNWELRDKDSLVICGPTASGKTRLGVAAARELGAEIVSVDSRQVYRGLDIGSGKDLQEYTEGGPAVPVHGIDCAQPRQVYTLWHYQQECYRAIAAIRARGRIPVLVGGSGLYLEAVLRRYRLANVPEDPALRRELMNQNTGVLLAQLHEQDPALFHRTDRSSRKRIVRAIEIARYGHTSQGEQESPCAPTLIPRVMVLRWPREVLHERIRVRLVQRLDDGLIDEVRGLREQGVTRERLMQLGMEYAHVCRYLDNEVDYPSMTSALLRDICRLAKRQTTWFAGMPRRGIAVEFVDRHES